jgi:hypothetical protein
MEREGMVLCNADTCATFRHRVKRNQFLPCDSGDFGNFNRTGSRSDTIQTAGMRFLLHASDNCEQRHHPFRDGSERVERACELRLSRMVTAAAMYRPCFSILYGITSSEPLEVTYKP